MASKTRSILRNMAHVQMAKEGIQQPNKEQAKGFFDHFAKYDHKGRRRNSRFAFSWREYAARRTQAVKTPPRRRAARQKGGAAQ